MSGIEKNYFAGHYDITNPFGNFDTTSTENEVVIEDLGKELSLETPPQRVSNNTNNRNAFIEDDVEVNNTPPQDNGRINQHAQQSENPNRKKQLADERVRFQNQPPLRNPSNRQQFQQSLVFQNGRPSLAQKVEEEKKGGAFDGVKNLANSLLGISTAATNSAQLVEELFTGVLRELYKERGLAPAIWDILFGVEFQEGMSAESEVERLIEDWLGEGGLFNDARRAVAELYANSNDYEIDTEQFHKQVQEAKKKAFIAALKRHFEEAAYFGAKGAADGVIEAFINKLMEGYVPKKKENAPVLNSNNIIFEGKDEEELIDEEDKRIGVVNALAYAFTGGTEVLEDEGFMGAVMRHGVKLFNRTLVEQLSPESEETNFYSTVSIALFNEVKPKHRHGLVGLLKDELRGIVNEVVAPVVTPMNQFLNEATHTIRSVKQSLGIPVAPQPQPAIAFNNGSNIINEAPPQQQSEVAPPNNNDEGVQQPPRIVELGGVGSKLMGYLANSILGGAVESVPPIVVNQMAKLLKWGINYAKDNIAKPEGAENDENEPLFDDLINALDQIIDKEGKPPFETAQRIYKALQAFAKNVSDNGGLVTIDGFPFLSFLFDKSADFSATPTFDNVMAEMGKTPREMLEPEDSDDDSDDAVVSIHPFKKNMAKYIGARVTYEVIAGLKPKGNFYMDLFAKSRRNEKLEGNLFSALKKAHEKGKISAVRLWLTKLAYSFVQPMSKLLFDPFIDNGDKQAKSLRKKKIAEKTAEEFRGEVTNYAAGVVNAYEDIAKGLGDRSKNIDGAMMEKLKEPAYNGGRTIKERHLKMATTAIEDLGPGFTFANRYFKRLSSAKFADKSYFKILNLPMAVLKIPFYLMGSIVLYPLQSIMTRGLKWGMKKAMEGVDLVDDVVEKSSAAFDNDLNLKRVKLQGIHDFLINMIAKGKHLEEGKEVEKSVISDGDKKKFRSVVANILLAMEYNNAETIPELQEIIEENRTSSKNAFSFLGIKVDVNKHVNKKIHESIVEKVAEGYKQAIDENLVAQQVNNIKKAMNGIFDQRNSAGVKSLKEDIHRLERENEALLEEAIKTFVKQAVDEELDTSGDKRLQKLARVTKIFKVKLVRYVAGQKGINTLDLRDGKVQSDIIRLQSGAELSRKSVTKILLDPKNKKLNKLHYQKFSELHTAYINSLYALQKFPDDSHLQVAQEAFNVLDKWQENIQIPKGTNISFFPEAVKVVKDIAKGGVRDQAKKKIDSFMDLMFKQWNVAALANMGMTMYGDRRFPFQKGK